jgi:hypothetical protein
MANDKPALAVVSRLRVFGVTSAISRTYQYLIDEHRVDTASEKKKRQRNELVAIAEQEQLNVLQPLIYDDPLLKVTMDVNHRFSRLTNGWLSPKFKVIYKAAAVNNDPELETVFDAPKSVVERFSGEVQSLPSPADRMRFVQKIAKDFDFLMTTRPGFMEEELVKISEWVEA